MNMKEQIENLKAQLEEAKQEKAESEGIIKTLLAGLKKDFNLNSLEEAEKEIKTLEAEINKLNAELEKEFDTLKNNYEW